MKVKLKATVTFEWEDDTEWWEADGIKTKEELIPHVDKHCQANYDYFLESAEITSIKVEEA